MLYDEYRQKVQQRLALLRKIRNIAAIVLGVAAVICAAVLGYEFHRGVFTSPLTWGDSVYGEALTPSAAAFRWDVVYEFRDENGQWTQNPPAAVGTYTLRGKTVNRLGVVRYSNEVPFSILCRPLSIQPQTLSFAYGDSPECTRDTLLAEGLAPGDEIARLQLSVDTSLLGMQPATISDIVIQNARQQDVTHCYRLTLCQGAAEIVPRKLTVNSASAVKEYDAAPLTAHDATITQGSLCPGHRLETEFTGAQTQIGESDNLFSAKIFDERGRDVSAFYDLTLSPGTLMVTQRKLTIKTNDAKKVYDGKPLKGSRYEILFGSLLPGHSLSVEFLAEAILAGETANHATATVLEEAGDNVTDLYNLRVDPGTLSITKRRLYIQTGSASKLYDGKPLHCREFEITSGTPADGERVVSYILSDITNVGTTPNHITFHVMTRNFENRADCYEFILTCGTLEVLPNTNGGQGGSTSGNGNGSGGTGSASLDFPKDTTVSTNAFSPSSKTAFRFFSSDTDGYYLKGMSYGDYIGRGFEQATPYPSDVFPYNRETHAIYPGSKISEYSGNKTQLLFDYGPAHTNGTILFPYDLISADFDPSFPMELTDTFATFSDRSFLPYCAIYAANSDEILSSGIYRHWQDPEELQYREYVRDHYTDLPADTREAALQFLADNGITRNMTIWEIGAFVQGCGTYNLNFQPIPQSCDDIAMYFLTVSKEGICQHFATAGTVLFRALGYPARYVTGYFARSAANEWVEVPASNAHAWVEVYLDGFGWVPVEVTGSGLSPENQPPTVDTRPKVIIQSYGGSREYTGQPFTEDRFRFLENNLQPQHQLYFMGTPMEYPGTYANDADYLCIRDTRTGRDVTHLYNVQVVSGTIQILTPVITISTGSASKKYDGTPLSCSEYTIINGALPENFSLEVVMYSHITEKGSVPNKPFQVMVYYHPNGLDDAMKVDVTHCFVIEYGAIGSLTVF